MEKSGGGRRFVIHMHVFITSISCIYYMLICCIFIADIKSSLVSFIHTILKKRQAVIIIGQFI